MELSTATLTPRDFAPPFALLNSKRELTFLQDLAGSPIVLIFYAHDAIPACLEVLTAFRDRIADYQKLNTKVLSISMDSPEARAYFAAQNNLPFPLLSDPNLEVSQAYGVWVSNPNSTEAGTYNRVIFLLDPDLRIVKIYSPAHLAKPADEILDDIKDFFPPQKPQHIQSQAPVLLIPNVLSRDDCQELINLWEYEGHSDSGFMKPEGQKTVGYLDYSHKIRTDHVIQPGRIKDKIDAIMLRRVFPKIKQAFHYETTRREAYKIGCYDSSTGGFFRPHRDNTAGGTAHRKFAMTLNLNAEEYEGGYLRFPEYGSHLYKPDTGSAVIFSCSLLHEATDVISGRRFALLSFFYGDREAQQRIEYERQAQNEYDKVVVKN